jgi:hypothetical protein
LVVKRVASLQELETWWSIDDVRDANEALDAMAEAEAIASKKK